MLDQTILITGGSRGIGQALVQHFSAKYHTVITTATSSEKANKAQEEFHNQGQKNIHVLPLDLGNKESITAFTNQLKENKITPEALINNAGITQDNISLRLSEEQWSSVIDVNLSGTFFLTKALMRNMLKNRQGRVIFLSSVVASTGNPGQANYCASKAGILGLMRSLALELGSKNITVNAISPGFIETDMTAKLTEQQRQVMLDKIPSNKFGSPADICHAAEFLCSKNAGYITGQNLNINGGLYIT